MKNDYFDFMLDNLGFQFRDSLTQRIIDKGIIHEKFKGNSKALRELSSPRGYESYRREKKADWIKMKFNNEEIMVCSQKFVPEHGVVRLADRNQDELRAEAKRMYDVLAENGKIELEF